MLLKYFLSKTIISAVLLGSILTELSWAMEDAKEFSSARRSRVMRLITQREPNKLLLKIHPENLETQRQETKDLAQRVLVHFQATEDKDLPDQNPDDGEKEDASQPEKREPGFK